MHSVKIKYMLIWKEKIEKVWKLFGSFEPKGKEKLQVIVIIKMETECIINIWSRSDTWVLTHMHTHACAQTSVNKEKKYNKKLLYFRCSFFIENIRLMYSWIFLKNWFVSHNPTNNTLSFQSHIFFNRVHPM